ncbi:triose-phosphate isomerase family protein [Jonesiaceae bacterium BS-20]|uniref:Triosephosphate isomerase n=1 Tax=Jonesiaceae bacterium BS-20 TaxID=3120821 RepID=A0AAU7DUY8_9MICO
MDTQQLTGVAGRRPVTLGVSFKQYLDVATSVAWVQTVAAAVAEHPAVLSGQVQLFVLPSLPALDQVARVLEGSPMQVGAQDLFWEDRGAYTGGISGADLAELGSTYVEVGHAERRKIFGEDVAITRRKFAAAVRNGLTPVLCVGEQTAQDADSAAQTCIAQLESAIAEVTQDELRPLVVAYEPEWAIGAPAPAPAEHVTAVVNRIRARMAQIFGLEQSAVIYGGSAKPGLLTTLGADVDGLFLGRFAHDPAAFLQIIDEAAQIR